jgi:hypothetical protein
MAAKAYAEIGDTGLAPFAGRHHQNMLRCFLNDALGGRIVKNDVMLANLRKPAGANQGLINRP